MDSRIETCKLIDLEQSGMYSKNLIESLKKNEYSNLRDYLSPDELSDWDIMGPILHAIKNEYNTYIIYKYCGENIQSDPKLSREILREEVKLIEGTPLSRDKEFIKKSIDVNPNVMLYMSDDLKSDTEFLKDCISNENIGVEQLKSIIQDNPKLAKDNDFMVEAAKKDASMVLLCDKELKSDYKSMEKICRENDEVISYIASNTNEFGKEGLQASKDVLVDKSSENVINGFKEEMTGVNKQIEQAKQEGKSEDDLKDLVQRSKQLQRHAKFFERIQSGEIDAVKATKLIDKLCQNLEPEYRRKIEQLLTLDKAIVERDKSDKETESLNPKTAKEKGKSLLETAVKATEETVTTGKINNEVKKIRDIQAEKNRQGENSMEEQK